MTYSFDSDIAILVGVDSAVFYSNLAYWVNKNRDSNNDKVVNYEL